MLERHSFGTTLAGHEGVQWLLGEAAMAIEIGRLLTMKAAGRLDAGDFARSELSMAKIHVSETLHKAIDTAIQLMGAKGYSKDTPLEWMYRYARQARLVDGASEVHKMVLGPGLPGAGQGFLELALTAMGLPARRAAVAAWLAGVAEAREVVILEARPLTGGAIQENWFLRVAFSDGPRQGEQALVLRTDAPSGVAVSHSRAREFQILSVAWRAGVSVPEPLWLCRDAMRAGPAVLSHGLPRRCIARGNKLVRDGAPCGDKEVLVERLGQELAKIHKITPPRPELDFLTVPEGSPALRDIALYRDHLDALDQRRPALEWALRWAEVIGTAAAARSCCCIRISGPGTFSPTRPA